MISNRVRRLSGSGNPLRWYFWRAWLPDGLIIDKFDERGHEHSVAEITNAGPPLKMAWINFSVERAKKCWEQGVPAIPSVTSTGDEKVMAELESPDGRMILPTTVGRKTVDFGSGSERTELIEYHLQHPQGSVVLHPGGQIETTGNAQYFSRQAADIGLDKHYLTKEFEVKKRGV